MGGFQTEKYIYMQGIIFLYNSAGESVEKFN